MAFYNYKTGLYENKNDTYRTQTEASKNKWKCEKCSEKFQSYRTLCEHKSQYHSY
jgi:hypothetical protein